MTAVREPEAVATGLQDLAMVREPPEQRRQTQLADRRAMHASALRHIGRDRHANQTGDVEEARRYGE